MSSQPPAPRQKLDALQCLRAVAAFAVVLGHVSGAARLHPELFGLVERLRFPGGAGVDIFFLLSGFIMVFASERMFGSWAGSREFLSRRLIRIVPLYWSATALTLLIAALGTHKVPSVAAIAASFAFLPYDTTGRGDGFAFPIIDLGWTLNYEMFFYLIFAGSLRLRREYCAIALTMIMALIVVLGQSFAPMTLPLRVWSRPIILEFVAGMLIALSYRGGFLRLSRVARFLLVTFAVSILLADPLHLGQWPTTPNGFTRVIAWGVPSGLLLVAAAGGPAFLNSLPARMMVLLGDASYALYLLHPFVILMMVHLTKATGLLADAPWTFVLSTLFASCVTAVLAHKYYELPVTTGLTRIFRSGKIAAFKDPSRS